MSDPTTDPISTSKLIGWLVLGFLSLFGWVGKRLVNRVDVLESRVVDKEEYGKTIERIRKDIKDGNEKTQGLIIDLYKNQNNKY